MPDIAHERRYPAEWRALLASCGLAAMRSTPVRGADGRVLGSFAMYFDAPRDPTPANPELPGIAARLAAIALQRAGEASAMRQEIAARREVEAALRAQQAQLRAVIETVPAAVWFTHDPDASRVGGNAEAAKLLRMPEAANSSLTGSPEQRPTHFRLIRNGADIPPERLPMQRAARGETVAAEELELVFQDGSSAHILARATPLRDTTGALAGAVCAALDITERKRAETALRHSEEEFRALGENLPNLCWMARADGGIYWYNRGWYDYTGATPEQMEGWGWRSVHDPAVLPEVMRRWTEAIAAGAAFEMTFPLRGADGVFRPFLTRIVPVRDAAGCITRWFGNNVEISEQQRTEAALRLSKEALRRLNEQLGARVAEAVAAREQAQQRLAHAQRMEALGQLAGGMAHDFNNVLQAVLGGLRLIERRAGDAGAVDQVARMIGEAVERGGRVTARLLSFARKGELQAAPVPAAALLEGMREMLAATLGAPIAVEVVADADAPPLVADKAQLETVLVNLAVNARDAMPEGGTLTLSVVPDAVADAAHPAGLAPGEYVRLELADTGLGMDAAVLARASEPFFTTKPDGEGTGLGLAMARGFAEQSGGGFAISSAPGQGTTVSLWFPQVQAAAQREQAQAAD